MLLIAELLQSLEAQRQKIKANMDKLLRLYMADQISSDGFGRENRPLEEQLRQLDEQIPHVQGEVDFLRIQYLSSDQIFTEAQNVYARWPELEFEEKRHGWSTAMRAAETIALEAATQNLVQKKGAPCLLGGKGYPQKSPQ